MHTPQIPYPELQKTLGLPNEVWLKREDKHRYGSHKGRSIPVMIAKYAKDGITTFCISSSGNAAIAATYAVINHNRNNQGSPLALTIFVGQKIDKQKFEIIKKLISKDKNIIVYQVERPKQSAFTMTKKEEIINLRQSTDDLALTGYFTLGEELLRIQNIQAIFIPTSSGTTAQAVGQYVQEQNMPVQIHIVQTTYCHPIINLIENIEQKNSTEKSTATAIVDKVAHRKQTVIDLIKQTNGTGWIATNDDIKVAIKLIKKTTQIDISPNSALAVVGLQKAITAGWSWTGPIVCLITGK